MLDVPLWQVLDVHYEFVPKPDDDEEEESSDTDSDDEEDGEGVWKTRNVKELYSWELIPGKTPPKKVPTTIIYARIHGVPEQYGLPEKQVVPK